jgi:hypothetical protein
MNHSHRPGTVALIMLLMAGSAIVLPAPDARADVDVVAVVNMVNNTVAVDLFVDGSIAQATVTREYTLCESEGIDEVFDTGLLASDSQKTETALVAPAWGNMSSSGSGFNISFNTSFDGDSRVSVKYVYSLEFHGAGALNFSRSIRCRDEVHEMFTWMILDMADLTFRLHSNIPVIVNDSDREQAGTEIMFNYTRTDLFPFGHYRSIDCHHLVCWNASAPAARVNETISSRLTPERHALMENLIESESVSMTIEPGASGLSYFLHGIFRLNGSVLQQFGTVWLWFPNNISSARAWICDTACEVQQSARDGQRGFYILVHPQGARWPRLVVDIPGNMTETWCDFFIVTVPVQESSIRYILPKNTVITDSRSPFELAEFENSSEHCILDFHGRCQGRGPVHIEWDPMTLLPCYLNVSVSNITCESARLAWETSVNPDFLKYQVLRSGVRGEPGAVVAELGNQETSGYTVLDLSPNTTCYLTVRKVMFPNRSIQAAQLGIHTAPDPPKAPRVTAARQPWNVTTAAVSWNPATGKDFLLYRIFASSGRGVLGARMADLTDPNATSYNITGLDPKITYYITVITLTNHSGEAYSEQAIVEPQQFKKTDDGNRPEAKSNQTTLAITVLALAAIIVVILLSFWKKI